MEYLTIICIFVRSLRVYQNLTTERDAADNACSRYVFTVNNTHLDSSRYVDNLPSVFFKRNLD